MEKVVVPEFVAYWYEKNKHDYILSVILDELGATEDEAIVNWRDNCKGRFVNHLANAEEIIAKMYLFEDYEVEEEKKYYWRKKKEYMFSFADGIHQFLNIDSNGVCSFGSNAEIAGYRTNLTETQVRQAVSEEDFNKLEKVEI